MIILHYGQIRIRFSKRILHSSSAGQNTLCIPNIWSLQYFSFFVINLGILKEKVLGIRDVYDYSYFLQTLIN